MKSFHDFLVECDLESVDEALIEFGGRSKTQFGQVLIMSGGAASGKGFVLDKLVGLEGKVLDVDELKSAAIRSKKINEIVKKEFGVDLSKVSLKNPNDVAMLHQIISNELNMVNKKNSALFASILSASPDRKPNIIFDVTLKDLRKLQEIVFNVTNIGYKKENIHIVWVVNDIEVAKEQNASRARTVPVEILMNTHSGAALTMKNILDMGDKLKSYMDGYIYLAFNSAGVDSEFMKSNTKKGGWVKKANYVTVKRPGRPQQSSTDLDAEIIRKIKSYIPGDVDWTAVSGKK